MSGAMRKMGVYLGLLEDQDGVYADADYADDTAGYAVERKEAPVAKLADRRKSNHPAPVTASLPMSRICPVHPRTYNDAKVIGENFREGTPVIINLSDMADGDDKRLIDFAAGLAFAVHGSIEKITKTVFLLTPPNVSIAESERQIIEEGGFFNQS